jgi:hypothetical protein
MNLYQFSETRWRGSEPTVCVGPISFVSTIIGKRELAAMFGGYIVYTDDDTNTDFLGVWGVRNASKFRRILREGGGSFTLRRGFPPRFRLKMRNVTRRKIDRA